MKKESQNIFPKYYQYSKNVFAEKILMWPDKKKKKKLKNREQIQFPSR